MKTKAKNIPEFIALIKRYETITLKEIKEKFKKFGETGLLFYLKEELTGFGNTDLCILCILCNAVNQNCNHCVYKKFVGCSLNNKYKEIEISYQNIYRANTAIKLFNAYRNRAKVLRKFAEEKDIEIN
jgi:hypothetical protein